MMFLNNNNDVNVNISEINVFCFQFFFLKTCPRLFLVCSDTVVWSDPLGGGKEFNKLGFIS